MAKNTLDDAIAGLKDLAKEVKRYCERLINNAKFDRTAVGTIVKVLDDHSGYVVAAFGKEYTIASNALFQVNDAVAVIAPQNDFKRLYIKPYEIDRNLLKQDKVEEDLKDYVNKVDKLQEQVDGKVEQYFYNYDPTLENWPAMSWKDDATKKAHNGDLFYNTDSKKGWQWTYNEETKTGSWVEVTDKETLDTLEAASKAQDTGDGKRQVFTADASKGEHPEPPYDTGDLWFNGEDILVCTVARTASDKYNASDWVKKDSYASKDDMKNYVDAVDKKLTQKDIFNRLTNNGAAKGIFIDEDTGNLYFSADFISTGTLMSSDQSIMFNLADGSLTTTNEDKTITTTLKNGGLTLINNMNQRLTLDCSENGVPYLILADEYDENSKGYSELNINELKFVGSDGNEGASISVTGLYGDIHNCRSINFTNDGGGTMPGIYSQATSGDSDHQLMLSSQYMVIFDTPTTQAKGSLQLYKPTDKSVPAFYIYDGTTNWGGQTLGWDGSKEVTALDANTQAVPFVYGIELVKNAQGYVTDVKLKQHGLRFIGGILV